MGETFPFQKQDSEDDGRPQYVLQSGEADAIRWFIAGEFWDRAFVT